MTLDPRPTCDPPATLALDREDFHQRRAWSKSTKTVLHIYSGNLYGGIETLLGTLARTVSSPFSTSMEFALCFGGRLHDELRAAGAVVHDLGPVRFRHPWTLVRARNRLADLLKNRKFAAIVTHSCWPHALFAPVARRAKLPIVFWQHDFVGSGHWLERLAARTYPNLVISNSHASAATLPRLFPGLAAEIIPCPVEPAVRTADAAGERKMVRSEFATPTEATVIVQACRLEPYKGHALLLEALGQLRNQPDWVAWIVGGSQRPHERVYLAELEAQAIREGIAHRVRFVGQRTDVSRLLAAADIHCQPNIGPEPFGIAFVEALYAGLPVVTTCLGGAAEIVTDKCGVLVEPGNPTALASVLRRLIDDPATRTRLGESGPARATKLCDPSHILSRLCEVLGGASVFQRL